MEKEYQVSQDHIDYTFEQNPEVDHVLVAQDGNVWLPKFVGFCKDHCARTSQEFKRVYRDTKVEDSTSEAIELTSLKKTELMALAKELNIEVPSKAKNAKIIELIEAKREELQFEAEETDEEVSDEEPEQEVPTDAGTDEEVSDEEESK